MPSSCLLYTSYLGIEPSYSAEELMGVDTTVPNVIGMSVEEAKDRLKERGFACKVEGDGETITDQTPVGGAIKMCIRDRPWPI